MAHASCAEVRARPRLIVVDGVVCRAAVHFLSTLASFPQQDSCVFSEAESCPLCLQAAVVGYEHPIKGQGIYAFVTLMEG